MVVLDVASTSDVPAAKLLDVFVALDLISVLDVATPLDVLVMLVLDTIDELGVFDNVVSRG